MDLSTIAPKLSNLSQFVTGKKESTQRLNFVQHTKPPTQKISSLLLDDIRGLVNDNDDSNSVSSNSLSDSSVSNSVTDSRSNASSMKEPVPRLPFSGFIRQNTKTKKAPQRKLSNAPLSPKQNSSKLSGAPVRRETMMSQFA